MTDFERRKALYEYLKKSPDRWQKQEDIAKALPALYGTNARFFPFSKERRVMTDDIRQINEDAVFELVIISSTRGCKLANSTEAESFCRSEASEIFKKLKRRHPSHIRENKNLKSHVNQ